MTASMGHQNCMPYEKLSQNFEIMICYCLVWHINLLIFTVHLCSNHALTVNGCIDEFEADSRNCACFERIFYHLHASGLVDD